MIDLFNEIGKHPSVIDRYGRAITYRDVVVQSLMYTHANELEALMLGEKEVMVGRLPNRTSSFNDMVFLRPSWKLSDQQVRNLKNRIQRLTAETGLSFYDLIDKVGAKPRIVEMYGRPITRFDVNPEFEYYARRQSPQQMLVSGMQ